MRMYLRFTVNPTCDIQRGTSYHTLGNVAEDIEMEGGFTPDGNRVIVFDEGTPNEMFATEIGGLCGYLLESETLEEAIEEAKDGTYPYGSIAHDTWAIFSGNDPRIQNAFGDGDIFRPLAILHVEEILN